MTDSKLGGCDLIALRVSDVAPNGYALDRASSNRSAVGTVGEFSMEPPTWMSLGCFTGQMAIRGD